MNMLSYCLPFSQILSSAARNHSNRTLPSLSNPHYANTDRTGEDFTYYTNTSNAQ